MDKRIALGMAWYRKADYPKLMNLFADGAELHASYEDWLQAAEGGLEHLRAKGVEVHKVYIDPATFPAWCEASGMKIDSDARKRFASEAVARMYIDLD